MFRLIIIIIIVVVFVVVDVDSFMPLTIPTTSERSLSLLYQQQQVRMTPKQQQQQQQQQQSQHQHYYMNHYFQQTTIQKQQCQSSIRTSSNAILLYASSSPSSSDEMINGNSNNNNDMNTILLSNDNNIMINNNNQINVVVDNNLDDTATAIYTTSTSAAATSTTTTPSTLSSSSPLETTQVSSNDWKNTIMDVSQSTQMFVKTFVESLLSTSTTTISDKLIVEEIIQLCNGIDLLQKDNDNMIVINNNNIDIPMLLSFTIRYNALQYRRYELLVSLMKSNYTSYIATASFICPSRISRKELPNVQDVPYNNNNELTTTTTINNNNDELLIADCTLNDMKYQDSILDNILLYIFRQLVTKHTNGVTSNQNGIDGLLEQGRLFMLQTSKNTNRTLGHEQQHIMVYNTLKDLMTPILPPFFRIFMSGVIPKSVSSKLPSNNDASSNKDDTIKEIQLGPWFYAPYLVTLITPVFFKFLVGPSYMNRHKSTGEYGGLLVEKCKFLQISNCKTLCIHQCKIPAQNFFANELNMNLTVSPNFITQECQWSFNQAPLPYDVDPTIPKGCITGCQSRSIILQ